MIVYSFYDWDSPSEQSIRTIRLGGGGAQELVAGDGLRRSPSWSHDGRRIAYVAAQEHVGTAAIVIMSSDGSAPKSIPLGDIQNVYHADWSPDGATIVFSGHEANRDPGGRLSLYSVKVATGVVTQLTAYGSADTHASWSPDGKWIVFASGGYLDVIDADGGQRKRLRGERTRYVPSWSPAGSTIAYIRGDRDIHLIGSDGKGRETVAVFEGLRLRDLSWSPTGRSLLFTSTVGGARRISRVEIDGSNVVTIVETRDGYIGRPRLFVPSLGPGLPATTPLLWGGLKRDQGPASR